MKYFKALFLDLDGTILTSQQEVSPKIVKTINLLKNNGILIVLATGRSWESTEYFYKTLKLDGPTICYNGAVVVKGPNGQYAFEKGLDNVTGRYLIEQARERGLGLVIYRNRKFYFEKMEKEIKSYLKRVKFKGEMLNFDDFSELNLTKCIFISEHWDRLESIRLDLQAPTSPVQVTALYSNDTCLETVAHNIDKGSGIKEVCKLYGIPVSESVAIGDGWNDYPMLSTAGESWVMGGAPQDLKDRFPKERILPSSDEDGAVLVMESILKELS